MLQNKHCIEQITPCHAVCKILPERQNCHKGSHDHRQHNNCCQRRPHTPETRSEKLPGTLIPLYAFCNKNATRKKEQADRHGSEIKLLPRDHLDPLTL